MALRLLTPALTLLVSMAFAAVPVQGAEPAPAEFSFSFDTARTGVPADASVYILYKNPEDPDNPEARPPALTRVVIAAPRGTVFDGTAVPACPASDAELMTLGQAACPPASAVGGGFGSVMTTEGPSEPHVADVTLFNYGEGIVELLEFVDGGLKVADRARFEDRRKMVLQPAVIPGFTEREFRLNYDGDIRAGELSPLIRTPRHCPRRGFWNSRLTYTVTTGDTYTARSR